MAAITNRSHHIIPTIDFTQHQLENGEMVSTTERVVKDVSVALFRFASLVLGYITSFILDREGLREEDREDRCDRSYVSA